MPDRLDQVESNKHIGFMLDVACDKNNTELDKKQDLRKAYFIQYIWRVTSVACNI